MCDKEKICRRFSVMEGYAMKGEGKNCGPQDLDEGGGKDMLP